MKDLILIGKQGSGKGTQGVLLAKKFGFMIFETGAALRAIAKEDSELGRKVKSITTRGDLVPNEIVMEIVGDFLKKIPEDTPVIFDGIPRSEIQRQSLEAEMAKAGRAFLVLEIRLSNQTALERLLKRAKCNECGANFGGDTCPQCGSDNISRRADDNEAAIRKRLENFETHTAPLVEIWKTQGRVISVDGETDIDTCFQEILKKLSTEEHSSLGEKIEI